MRRVASHPAKKYPRHPRPPAGSRLKPAQYAKLRAIVGTGRGADAGLLHTCREALAHRSYGECSVDELIDVAVRRIFSGRLPKGMRVPTNREALVDAVIRLGELHWQNTQRNRRRKGARHMELKEYHAAAAAPLVPSEGATAFQSTQIEALDRLEAWLLARVEQIKAAERLAEWSEDSALTIKLDISF